MTRKIAPTLQYAHLARARSGMKIYDGRKCKAELRALLAVARAARKDRDGSNGGRSIYGHIVECRCELCRALARLDDVSAGTDEGGTGGRTKS